ncbi:hypothetical protein [Neptunomonas concharum]|jgi:hypothetical protein|uniref:Uncharacterized protein n=1 Tax=Neptunomonas concharum TaxID=1031538 RepID=A0A5P1REE3_9GAMM|nr:hypothetical protein [Neptunomonas concharum]QEQ97977.1 hypothetical protein F0U83_15365 [Neptunomonas concharum]
MSVIQVKNKERVINELMLFIRKVFAEPEICTIAKEITRKHMSSPNAAALIAEELSATTNVKIPLEHSEADDLFLDLLIDIVKDETALY